MSLRFRRKRKRPPVLKKPGLYVEEILRWADAWKARTGVWPKAHSGCIPESLGDKWCTIESALRKGMRGLPGGSSLAQLLAERRGVRNLAALPHFQISKILAWADAWKARTGQWPRIASGRIPESPSEKWVTINTALDEGLRGLPGGSSLPQLLAERRGVPNQQRLPPLNISKILRWADAWKARTGDWPKRTSGLIPESPGEKWSTIESALRDGGRGLPGGSSLAQLLAQRRGVRNLKDLPRFEISKILAWAEAWKARTGSWPKRTSGRIPESSGDRWCNIDDALRTGLRGLPGGSTLARLLADRRGARNHMRLPPFEISTILGWIDAYHRRTGDWPRATSGSIAEVAGETWMAVDRALFSGRRGLPGGCTLGHLLAKERALRIPGNLPHLSEPLILSWVDAYFRRTGAWPRRGSGAIQDQPGEKWQGVDNALRMGLRGLPSGSSLYQFLVAQGRIKPPCPQGLKRRRIEGGLPCRELADKVGVNPNTLRSWERGLKLPRQATLAALANVLGLAGAQLRAEMKPVQIGWRKKQSKKRTIGSGAS